MAALYGRAGRIRERRRQGEDIYAEQYNSLCSWALSVFPGDPSLEGKLSKMPDAVTQARPDMGIERLLARVSYLESALAMILQVDPRELPEAKGAADVDSLTQVKARRFQFLRRLYESTRGRSQLALDEQQVGQQLGMPPDELDAITEYLDAEGLIEFPTYGHVSITHAGVREVEAALDRPEQPTPHFPPVNFIYVEQMSHSQIQQGTTSSTQTGTFGTTDLTPISQFIEELRTRLADLKISEDDQHEANLQIATVQAQLSSRRPSFSIIRESLHTIRNILEGGVGSAAATVFITQLPQLIDMLPK